MLLNHLVPFLKQDGIISTESNSDAWLLNNAIVLFLIFFLLPLPFLLLICLLSSPALLGLPLFLLLLLSLLLEPAPLLLPLLPLPLFLSLPQSL
jgi:hypothetical protein